MTCFTYEITTTTGGFLVDVLDNGKLWQHGIFVKKEDGLAWARESIRRARRYHPQKESKKESKP